MRPIITCHVLGLQCSWRVHPCVACVTPGAIPSRGLRLQCWLSRLGYVDSLPTESPGVFVDWLTFIVEITRSLASWPVVAAVFLFWLRPHYSELVNRIETVKFPGGAEALFRKELQKATLDAEALPKRAIQARTQDAAPDFDQAGIQRNDFLTLSATFPEAAVMYSFQNVEHILNEIGEKLGVRPGQSRRVIELLREREVIGMPSYDLYNRLSKLRNIAVHQGNSNLTQEEALQYQRLADAFVNWLRVLLERLGDSPSNSEGNS